MKLKILFRLFTTLCLCALMVLCSQESSTAVYVGPHEVQPLLKLASSVSLEDINRAEAIVSGAGVDDNNVFELLVDKNGKKLYGTLRIPESVTACLLVIRMFDVQNRKIGEGSCELAQSHLAVGRYVTPVVGISSAKPRIDTLFAAPETAGINDSIMLYCTASDSFSGTIAEYAWKCGNGSWLTDKDGDTTIVAPSTAQTLVCSLRVTDDDGNVVYAEKLVTIEPRLPIALAGNDTTLGLNDVVKLNGSASHDDTRIIGYAWKCGSSTWFTDKDGDTTIVAPSIAQTLVCSLRVTDDDGNLAYAVKAVTVEPRLPVAVAGNDTTLGINDVVTLRGSSSQDETSIVEYAWKCSSGPWLVDSDGDTTVTAPSIAQSWACSLRVTDDDGSRTYDAKVVTVETRVPVALAGNDTTLGIKDVVTLRGSSSQDETNIVEYAWKCGNGLWLTDKDGDTTIVAPSTAQALVCSLRVTDDDGNVTFDEVYLTTETRVPIAVVSDDTVVFVNEVVHLIGHFSSDESSIVDYSWKIGASMWQSVSNGDTVITMPGTGQALLCSLRVTDDDNNISFGEVLVEALAKNINDYDGNTYTVVRIGNQFWTVENLRTTHYKDGAEIPLVEDSATWVNRTIPGYCWYDKITSPLEQEKWGALYNWHAVNTGKLAPLGWRVPTDADWTVLEQFLIINGYNWDGTLSGNKIGKAMAAQTDWESDNYTILGTIGNDKDNNNASGFSALPSGYRSGVEASFWGNLTVHGMWWSSTGLDSATAYYRGLSNRNSNLYKEVMNKGDGTAIRLVRD